MSYLLALCHFSVDLGHKMYKCPDESHSTLYRSNWWDSATLLWNSCILFSWMCSLLVLARRFYVFWAIKTYFLKRYIGYQNFMLQVQNLMPVLALTLTNCSKYVIWHYSHLVKIKPSNARLITSAFYIHIMILWCSCFHLDNNWRLQSSDQQICIANCPA